MQDSPNIIPTEVERSACKNIDGYVAGAHTAKQTVEFINTLASKFRRKNFPFAYAGVRLAAEGRLGLASEVFALAQDDPFCRSVYAHLLRKGDLNPQTVIAEGFQGFDIWSRTRFSVRQCRLAHQAVEDISRLGAFSTDLQTPTIIDIGTGNGVVIADLVNSLAIHHNLEGVHLLLNDVISEALDFAERYCKTHISIPARITKLKGAIEDIEAAELVNTAGPSIWFAHGMAVIHHLPKSNKVALFKKLGPITKRFILTELEGNHDTPLSRSIDLIYSAYVFYGSLIGDTFKSVNSDEDRNECIRDFLLPEALGVLFNDYGSRQNYHMLESEWKDIIRQSGGHTVATRSVEVLEGTQRSMTLFSTWG